MNVSYSGLSTLLHFVHGQRGQFLLVKAAVSVWADFLPTTPSLLLYIMTTDRSKQEDPHQADRILIG